MVLAGFILPLFQTAYLPLSEVYLTMTMGFVFVLNSVLLGIGLAMDAFSVSMANGMNEPNMKSTKMCAVAGVFGGFQALMPLIGWLCVHTIVELFSAFSRFIPWIALILLAFIGGKMIIDGVKQTAEEDPVSAGVGFGALMVQGIATSIDALSVGFTISEYNALMAVVSTLIIGAVTLGICMLGLIIGRKFGTKLANKAAIFGGIILIGIGLEIFITGIF